MLSPRKFGLIHIRIAQISIIKSYITFPIRCIKEHNGLGLQLQKLASFTGLKSNHDHNWWVIIGTLGGNYDDIKLGLGPKLGWVYY